MKNVACLAMIIACSIAVFARDKTTFQIEVLGTDTWQRDVAIYHAAINGTSNTNCDQVSHSQSGISLREQGHSTCSVKEIGYAFCAPILARDSDPSAN